MAEQLLQQAAASKSLLGALRLRPGFERASAAEATRLLQLLRATSTTSAQLAALTTVITDSGFNGPDEAALLDAVADLLSGQQGRPLTTDTTARTQQQNWITILGFFTASVWKKISEQNINEVLDFLILMGLRNPSEKTYQTLSLGIIAHSNGIEKALNMPVDMKLNFNKSLKGMFKTKAQLSTPPLEWIQTLPECPADLKLKHPMVHDRVFADEVAVENPISQVHMSQLRMTSRCRDYRGGSHAMSSAASSGSISGSSSMPEQFMQLGMQMMREIAQIKNSMQGNAVASDSGGNRAKMLTIFSKDREASAGTAPQPSPLALQDGSVAAASKASVGTTPSEEAAPLVAAAPKKDEASKTEDGVKPMDDITKEILERLAAGMAKPKGKEKGKAKGKATPKGKASAKAPVKKKPVKRKETAPARPPLGAHPPIKFLSCTIYSDSQNQQWRAIELSDRRRDFKFKWNKADSWSRCVQWCRDAAKQAREV